MTAIPLNAANLHRLPPSVRVPTYDRAAHRPSLVHIGVGNFHRAHQAVYLDDLLHNPAHPRDGYCGVGLLPHDKALRDALRQQDFLYTFVARSDAGDDARVIGSIVDFLLAPEDPVAAVERMASPETKIVSLTVTEGGYYVDPATGQLDARHPDLRHDLAHPDAPRGTFGYLAAALRLQRERNIAPFAVLSCDNLQHNGGVLRAMFLAFLRLQNAALADWVDAHVAFPSCMVDRITPATTDAHRGLVHDTFGVADTAPVTAEPFRQWVIEDRFPKGRPAWQRVGAQLVTDVDAYERMKIRLLNGAHQVMAYVGLLLGHRTVPQAMADADVRTLLSRFMNDEVTPLLPSVPGVDLADYKATLMKRFANPAIADTLERLATDGANRLPKFVLPTAVEQVRAAGPIAATAFTIAAYVTALTRTDATGQPFTAPDPHAGALASLAAWPKLTAVEILTNPPLVNPTLATSTLFTIAVDAALARLRADKPRAALAAVLSEPIV